MAEPILVAYASKHGSTQEVAERIALTLGLLGLKAESRPAAEVEDVSGYGSVVLGGSLYMGRWNADARKFLRRHRQALAEMPVGVFALGPQTLAAPQVAQSKAQLEQALAKEPTLHPILVEIFGGVIEPGALHFPFSRMEPSDARDWVAIRRFAEQLGEALKAHTKELAIR
jgi:menaquinone-dependent protoporphyrinogen oxidase